MVKLSERDRWYVSLIWLAACSFAADWAGLHFMVGAFLSGAVMDAHWFEQSKMDLLREHVLLTIMPVFFLSTGYAPIGILAEQRSSLRQHCYCWHRLAVN
jgi:Kef-type K+ transport system membrane component KefB